jgi:hypothetical protein
MRRYFIVLLLLAALCGGAYWLAQGDNGDVISKRVVSSRGEAGSSSAGSGSEVGTVRGSSVKAPVDAANGRGAGGETTRRERDAASGGRAAGLRVKDIMASSRENPAWPAGPKVYAEIETSGTRFVNLRPNDAAMLPTLDVAANERLAVRLSFPEGTPGDRIFMELTDGGHFEDTADMGQVLEVGADRTLSFVFFADGRGGNCGLTFRQAGHSRVIPLWVGEHLPMAESAAP